MADPVTAATTYACPSCHGAGISACAACKGKGEVGPYWVVRCEINRFLDWPFMYEHHGWGTADEAARDEDLLTQGILKALGIESDGGVDDGI